MHSVTSQLYNLCGIFLDDISTREQFAFDLLLPSESSFPQSMHCTLLASVWPKYPLN